MKIHKSTIVIVVLLTAFWLSGVLPFLIQEPARDKCESIYRLLANVGQFMMLFLGLSTLRSRVDMAIIALAVAVTYYSTCIVNPESLTTWLSGFRRYIPYTMVLPVVRWLWQYPGRRARFMRIFDRNMYWFLWLQVPCLCYQAAVWGMGDNGGGSLGWYNSGIVTEMIYLISFYLMVRSWRPQRGYIGNLLDNWVLVFLLFPSFLNETKIAFILLALYFLLLVPFDRYLMRRLLVVVPLVGVLIAGSFWWYVSYVDVTGAVFKKDFFKDYVLGDNMREFAFELMESDEVDADEVWEHDYARGLKFALLPTLLEKGGTEHEIWGYGVGQFKGGNGMDKTAFAKQSEWLLRGTQTEMFNIVVELGYLGAALLLLYWGVVFRFFYRVGRRNRNRRMQIWLGVAMFMMIMYNAAFDCMPFVILALTYTFISSRWTQLPAFEKPYLFIPPKQPSLSRPCLPSSVS